MATFSAGHDCFYINSDSATLAVVSSGGAVNSTPVFGIQTRAVRLVALAPVSSTSGVRVKVVSPADSVVSSTLGAIIPINWPVEVKVVPGQRVSALSNNEVAATIVVTELI
jgi:hypothetical protein